MTIPPPPPGLTEWPKARLNKDRNKVVCVRCGNPLASRQRSPGGPYMLVAREGWVDQPREGVWSEAERIWRHPDVNPLISRTDAGGTRFKPRGPGVIETPALALCECKTVLLLDSTELDVGPTSGTAAPPTHIEE